VEIVTACLSMISICLISIQSSNRNNSFFDYVHVILSLVN
jgi:hypothetical protein